MAYDLLYFMSMVCPFAAESLQGHLSLKESPSCWGSRRQDFSAELCVAGAGSCPPSAVPALQALPAAPTSVHHYSSRGYWTHPVAVCEQLSCHFIAWKGKYLFIFSPLSSQLCEVHDSDYAHNALQAISLFLSVFQYSILAFQHTWKANLDGVY